MAQWLTLSISRLEHAASGPAALATACSLGAGRAPAHAVKGARCPWQQADRTVQTIGWLRPSTGTILVLGLVWWMLGNQAIKPAELVPSFALQQ